MKVRSYHRTPISGPRSDSVLWLMPPRQENKRETMGSIISDNYLYTRWQWWTPSLSRYVVATVADPAPPRSPVANWLSSQEAEAVLKSHGGRATGHQRTIYVLSHLCIRASAYQETSLP